MREKFQNFMYGRYGNDELNRFISYATLASIILEIFLGIRPLYFVSLILLVILYVRMLSRNISARYAENQKYLQIRSRITGIFRKNSANAQPGYKIFQCPQCSQKIRIPKGKGKIKIHCPKCGNDFIKKS